LFDAVVIAVAGSAPAYSIAASTAALVAAVGFAGPASLLYCGIPMLGIAWLSAISTFFEVFTIAVNMTLPARQIQANAGNVLAVRGQDVWPGAGGKLLVIAVLLSTVGNLQTSLIQVTRTLFAMARDRTPARAPRLAPSPAADPLVAAQQQVDRVRAAGGRRHHHGDHRPGRAAAGPLVGRDRPAQLGRVVG
jgi:hypothetical protein